MERTFIVRGDIIHAPGKERIEEYRDSFLVVTDGLVEGIFSSIPSRFSHYRLVDCHGHIVMPGLSDLHVHASQYQFRGLWMDEELIDWLNRHTFPEEEKYSDKAYAKRAYRIFVDDLVKSPTTRASIFATIHLDSTLVLARYLEDSGIKAYVGKVNMDRNSTPGLSEDSAQSVNDTQSFIAQTEGWTNVRPIITPRFIPSCTDGLMEALSRLAVDRGLPVQSHLSENRSEIEWVKELCPDSTSYADAYRRRGLWGATPTIMAHCVHSTGREEDLLAEDGIFIAHCPDSNANLSSGIMDARRYLDAGCRIGLGTDVAGGCSLSMLRAIGDAVRVSKLRAACVDSSLKALTLAEAFHMASVIGGSFFGRVGLFEPGWEADIVVLDESGIATTLEGLSLSERLERVVNLKSEGAVMHKAVCGRWLF